jgi:hypothetical protein
MIPYMSASRWSRLGLPPSAGGIACHSSPMAHIVTMDVVDKVPSFVRGTKVAPM